MKKPKIIECLATLLMFVSCDSKPDYDATGIFEATTVTVASETTGKILSFGPVEGDSISAGQPVAVIDTAMLVLQRRQLGSQQASAISSQPDVDVQAASVRAQISHQEQECHRLQRLMADGAATQKQLDDANAHLKVLRSQLQANISTLGKNRTSLGDNARAIEYQAAQIADQLERSVVKSPVSGTLLVKYAEVGEFAVPGKPLFKIANLNDIYLRGYFTSVQLADIKLGQKVTVIADFGDDKQYEYPGTITWISEESEFTPKSIQTNDTRANLVYAVKIAVKNDGRLKLGQYGEVKL